MKVLNTPTIRRMPTYLHKLQKMRQEGKTHVSSTELADYMNIEPIVVRKDIALTGISGQRRVGYEVNELIRYIKQYLGWEQVVSATLIGAGALGSALLGYDDFTAYGLNIETVFDRDPMKIGHEIRGREVFDIDTLESRLQSDPPQIAVICVGNSAAQQVADRLIRMGVKCIWNFANVSLKTPPDVIVQREVIAGGFALLSVKLKNSRSNNGGTPLKEE